MSVFEKFIETYEKAIDSKEVSDSIIKKYENVLPDLLINLWKKHGFGGYDNGLFWTINPDEYIDYMNKWVETKWKDMYPIMRTAFGDLIVIYCIEKDDEDYENVGIDVIDVRHCEGENITIGLEKYFKNYLLDTGRFMGQTNIENMLFLYGKMKLGNLKSDQCYGFEPIIALGGKEKEKNMKILNYKVHLDILTQAMKEKIEI